MSTTPASKTSARASIASIDAGFGVSLTRVTTGELELTFLPQFGGRLLSVVHDDFEHLWRRRSLVDSSMRSIRPIDAWAGPGHGLVGWANPGGSKTWPAPQGDGPRLWNGPPDPVIDSGPWSVETEVDAGGKAHVTLRSAADPQTGLRIERRFAVPPTGAEFVQTTTFVNESTERVSWSIWEVCQVDPSGAVDADAEPVAESAARRASAGAAVVAVGAASRIVDLGHYVGRLTPDQSVAGEVRVPALAAVGKLGFPDATGTVSFGHGDGHRLSLHFEVSPEAVYPDGGSRVEIWMQFAGSPPIAALGGYAPDETYVELEVLSPRHDLEPGQHASFEVRWELA